MSELLLNKEIYPIDAIAIAQRRYGALAKVRYGENNDYHILIFEKCYYDKELTMKEYENYVINLMVSKNGN